MAHRIQYDASTDPAACPEFACLARDPIEFIRAHHRLQLALCELLEALAADLHHPRAGDLAGMAYRYLDEAFLLHQVDEQTDLREALEFSTDFDAEDSSLFDLVEQGHRRDRELAAPVTAGVSGLAAGGFPDNPGAFIIALLQFAGSLRRHIGWEERVIVPFAVERLLPEARSNLLICMTERRRNPEWRKAAVL